MLPVTRDFKAEKLFTVRLMFDSVMTDLIILNDWGYLTSGEGGSDWQSSSLAGNCIRTSSSRISSKDSV